MTNRARGDRTTRLHGDGLDRRDFVLRAAAGLSIGLIGTLPRTTGASARGTIAAGPMTHQNDPTGGHGMASSPGHYALADDDAEAIWFIGTLALIKGLAGGTGAALATVEFIHPPRFATALHVHHRADEAFYVLAGAMRGVCGDQEWSGMTGSFVWLPRGIPHGYAVDGDETLRTLAITAPAGFDRFVVEAGEPAQERILPPPGPPDLVKLEAAGVKYGIETVGPPVQFTGTPSV